MILLPSVILIVWSSEIFPWVFGSQWHLAGEYAQCLILWRCSPLQPPAVLFAQLIRIQRTSFVYDLFLLAAGVCADNRGDVSGCLAHGSVFSVVGSLLDPFLILLVGSQ